MEYVKLDASSPEVQHLAKLVNEEPAKVASLLNQQRYRAAYNKQKNAAVRELKAKVKELEAKLKEVK